MTGGTVPTSEVDLFSDEVVLAPYDQYRRLRDAGPAGWPERHQAWAVGRYADVRAALLDHRTLSSAAGVGAGAGLNEVGNAKGTTLASDPPEHDLLHNVATHELIPHALRPLRQTIEQQARNRWTRWWPGTRSTLSPIWRGWDRPGEIRRDPAGHRSPGFRVRGARLRGPGAGEVGRPRGARRVRGFRVGDHQCQELNVIRALSRLSVTVTRAN